MDSLQFLAGTFGTDKNSHGFIEKYEELFSEMRKDSFNFLEIGVYMGSSIKMWNTYFENSKIFGIDAFEGIQGNGMTFDGYLQFYNEWVENPNPKIELTKCDQSKESELEKFVIYCKNNNIKFRTIIDDGSHLMRDQQITFSHFFELVENGGFYIVEDSHTSDDLTGYDLLPDYSNSTKRVLLDLGKNGVFASPYVQNQDTIHYIQENVSSIDNFVSRNRVSQTLIIRKK